MKGSRADRRKENTGINPFSSEKNWIGGDLAREAAPATSPGQISVARTEWIEKREEREERGVQGQERGVQGQGQGVQGQGQGVQAGRVAVGSKSAVELMQDILKGAREGEEVRSYYSREAEEALGELLTNKFKLGSYIKRLEGEMVGLDAPVVKNYELLVLLLQQVSGADVEVRQGDAGMEIRFNRGIIQRQEAEIERLEREKEERERQMKYVIDEYESIIFNFNDVIEKLVNREEGRHKTKF